MNTVISMYFFSDVSIKDHVRYIFASLFYKSEREHLSDKEKCFLFHFESYFRSLENQVLTFQVYSNAMTSSNA